MKFRNYIESIALYIHEHEFCSTSMKKVKINPWPVSFTLFRNSKLGIFFVDNLKEATYVDFVSGLT